MTPGVIRPGGIAWVCDTRFILVWRLALRSNKDPASVPYIMGCVAISRLAQERTARRGRFCAPVIVYKHTWLSSDDFVEDQLWVVGDRVGICLQHFAAVAYHIDNLADLQHNVQGLLDDNQRDRALFHHSPQSLQ